MTEQKLIGLLTPFFQPIPAYERAAAALGVELAIVTPSRVDWQSEEVQALAFDGSKWEEKLVPLPGAYYNRFYGPKPKVVNRLELLVGKGRVFNHITLFDKLDVHSILSQTPLEKHLPATYILQPENVVELLKGDGQAIIKPRTGQLGVGIYLVRKKGKKFQLHLGTKSPIASFPSTEELLDWLEANLGRGYIVQQYIPLATLNGRVFDVRFLVQKDGGGMWKASGALSRLSLTYSYITNVSHSLLPGGKALQQAFPGQGYLPKLEKLSLQAASAVEQALGSLGELSVDFGLDEQGRIWIIELNGKPMKSMFSALGDARLMKTVYERPICYALHLCSPSL
jgi:hypothetical protein